MLVLKDRLIGINVMSLHTGAKIAQVENVIVDPRHLKITAFYLGGDHLDFSPAVLGVTDVREFSDIGLIVDSANEIVSPNDLVRLQEVLKFNFKLDGLPVFDDIGKKIGNVNNYAVETKTFYIAKIHVNPGLFKFFGNAEVIIGRNQILEINNKQIVVKSATVKHESSVHTKLENPLRHMHAESMQKGD